MGMRREKRKSVCVEKTHQNVPPSIPLAAENIKVRIRIRKGIKRKREKKKEVEEK